MCLIFLCSISEMWVYYFCLTVCSFGESRFNFPFPFVAVIFPQSPSPSLPLSLPGADDLPSQHRRPGVPVLLALCLPLAQGCRIRAGAALPCVAPPPSLEPGGRSFRSSLRQARHDDDSERSAPDGPSNDAALFSLSLSLSLSLHFDKLNPFDLLATHAISSLPFNFVVCSSF